MLKPSFQSNDSTSTEQTVTISLDPAAYDPLGCTMCDRQFANYSLWVRHYCAIYNTSSPVNVAPR